MELEVLQDLKANDKEKPWRDKKFENLKLGRSLKRLGYGKRAERVLECANYLEFLRCLETGERFLFRANFCKHPLCPICQWLKSMKVSSSLYQVLRHIEANHPDLAPLFLTLTLENCSLEELKGTLDVIFKGWNLLVGYSQIRKIMQGWFRSVEIGYNPRRKDFHPHVHIVLLTNKAYFKGKDYIGVREWARLWGMALRVKYGPVVWIEKLKNIKGEGKGIKEVSKYVVKETDFLFKDKDLTDKVVGALAPALRHRRLHAYGGLMAKVKKELGLCQDKKPQLDKEGNYVLEHYGWRVGLTNYVKTKEISLVDQDWNLIKSYADERGPRSLEAALDRLSCATGA